MRFDLDLLLATCHPSGHLGLRWFRGALAEGTAVPQHDFAAVVPIIGWMMFARKIRLMAGAGSQRSGAPHRHARPRPLGNGTPGFPPGAYERVIL